MHLCDPPWSGKYVSIRIQSLCAKALPAALQRSALMSTLTYNRMEDSLILLSIPFVRAYRLHPDSKGLISHGSLNFLEYPSISLFGLTVGDYKCTLSPQLPVVKAEALIYLVSDFDGYIGLVLHPDTDWQLLEALDMLLLEHTQFESKIEPEQPSYSERIGNWLEGTSENLKGRMVSGSSRVGESLKRGEQVVKARTTPCQEERKVPKYVQSSAKGVNSATSFILTCSQTVTEKATKASELVGKVVASGYSRLRGDKPSARPSSTAVLASGALKALQNLLSGAEESVIILAKSAHDATVGVVEHKYGGEVSGVVSKGLGSVGNLGRTVHTLNQLNPLTVATNVAAGGLGDVDSKQPGQASPCRPSDPAQAQPTSAVPQTSPSQPPELKDAVEASQRSLS